MELQNDQHGFLQSIKIRNLAPTRFTGKKVRVTIHNQIYPKHFFNLKLPLKTWYYQYCPVSARRTYSSSKLYMWTWLQITKHLQFGQGSQMMARQNIVNFTSETQQLLFICIFQADKDWRRLIILWQGGCIFWQGKCKRILLTASLLQIRHQHRGITGFGLQVTFTDLVEASQSWLKYALNLPERNAHIELSTFGQHLHQDYLVSLWWAHKALFLHLHWKDWITTCAINLVMWRCGKLNWPSLAIKIALKPSSTSWLDLGAASHICIPCTVSRNVACVLQ